MSELIFPTTVMTEAEAILAELEGKKCPHCDQASLEWIESDDKLHAHCYQCGTRYTLAEPSLTLHEEHPELAEQLESYQCPSCQHQGWVIQFRCDLSIQKCFYFTGCPNCGRTFEEYR